ncbi:FAA hydrolase family protein [Litorivicinus lipolyticus]|uniref:FAA hydrolase family protein n=1 Tax=Litorivicinus lipolyticus TaxID=418701 RepID=A0A5Q2QIA0_9GAMM|nr:fumarylacetoacetate hydrolase family protein [Litorivicinus lipolyticus]QGG80755.1 FAA hydrolase family protein [Litorivicinus lipolyticus]
MHLFQAHDLIDLTILNDERRFPVHNIYCIGRNYGDHAIEMGFEVDREAPFYFMKPASNLSESSDVRYPPKTQKLQHEIELVVALELGGRDLTCEQALECIAGYAVGLDLTRRDLQIRNRDQGRPWEIGKVFDGSAPIGPLHLRSEVNDLTQGRIELLINGQVRQAGDLGDMIHSAAELIAYLSTLQMLQAGDLIFTGTPAGVSDLARGDVLEGRIEGLTPLSVTVV